MKVFSTVLLIFTGLVSFLIVGVAFTMGGPLYGSLLLLICLFLIYIANNKINKNNDVTRQKSLIELTSIIPNKLEMIPTKSI